LVYTREFKQGGQGFKVFYKLIPIFNGYILALYLSLFDKAMADIFNLTHHFLIAMPALGDPNFHHAVTYICEHNEQGAIGIIINRPLSVSLAEVLTGMAIAHSDLGLAEIPILFGGPLHPERGFVIHRPTGEWRATMLAADEIAVTTSRDILQAIADNQGPHDKLICLGYAAWEAGQLEQEITQNFWLHSPASVDVLFTTPYPERWAAAAALIGVDLNQLSTEAGHG
jgi:putative transcriptional regulator